MKLTNKIIIDDWSSFSQEDLIKFGDEGDEARKTLLDPNILELADDVTGKKVLDAGCGNGYLARKLARLGADETGIETSGSLYQYCIKREKAEQLGVYYIQQYLSSLNAADTYDSALLINVLMDISDYIPALKNCIEALRSGGTLIISILHPAFPGFEDEWKDLGKVEIEEYFNPEPIKQKYGYLFRRPLQGYINLLVENGCSIENLSSQCLNMITLETRMYLSS